MVKHQPNQVKHAWVQWCKRKDTKAHDAEMPDIVSAAAATSHGKHVERRKDKNTPGQHCNNAPAVGAAATVPPPPHRLPLLVEPHCQHAAAEGEVAYDAAAAGVDH
jgi:hypothetical protein